jgi:hypothetical protein
VPNIETTAVAAGAGTSVQISKLLLLVHRTLNIKTAAGMPDHETAAGKPKPDILTAAGTSVLTLLLVHRI